MPEAGADAAAPERDRPTLLNLVLRASTLHVGGTATQAWMRSALVDTGRLPADDFNRCFAVARLTPGTNLLAFYTALGYRMGGLVSALSCLTAGTGAPALMATVLGAAYFRYAGVAGVERFMSGARAGAVAVIAWGVGRLLATTTAERPRLALPVAVAAAAALWAGAAPVVILLLAALGGALWSRG